MKNRRMWGIGGGVLLALALLLSLSVMTPTAPASAQAPVSSQLTTTVLAATAVSGTVNTSASNVDAQGRDVALTTGWGKADVFFLATVGSGATLTATVQVSPDGTNWANAEYEYWTGSAIGTKTQQRVFTATGNKVLTLPLAGEYWRVNLLTTGGVVTTTVAATLHR